MKKSGIGILPFIAVIILLNVFSNSTSDFYGIGIFIFFMIFIYVIKQVKVGQVKSGETYTYQSRRVKQVKCTYCNQMIDAHADTCPICGNRQNETIECEYCGHINKGNLLQCEECNALLK
jgi:hypothetical protein